MNKRVHKLYWVFEMKCSYMCSGYLFLCVNMPYIVVDEWCEQKCEHMVGYRGHETADSGSLTPTMWSFT